LGASRWRWARAIVLPSLRSSIFAAYLLVFVAILKELPVTLLLGGPVGVRTLAFRVFDRYNEALFHDAGLAGLLLMAVTLSAFVLTIRWQR
jgi:iron(III) transport system permease protein